MHKALKLRCEFNHLFIFATTNNHTCESVTKIIGFDVIDKVILGS